MAAFFLDGNFFRLATWILGIANPDGSMPSSRPGDATCGEWTTSSMLAATLSLPHLAPELPALGERVAAARRWLGGRVAHDCLSAVPDGDPAIDPTASYVDFLCLSLALGLFSDEDVTAAQRAAESSIGRLVTAQAPSGYWPFFLGDQEPSFVSTVFAIRALAHAVECDALVVDDLNDTIARGVSWLTDHIAQAAPAQIGIALCEVGPQLEEVTRTEAVRLLLTSLRHDAPADEPLWEHYIERHGYMTVIRFGTPYCIAAVLGDRNAPEAICFRLLRWLCDNTSGSYGSLPGGQEVLTWPTRDLLLGIAGVNRTARARSLGDLFATLALSDGLSQQAGQALKFFAAVRPAAGESWQERLRQDVTILHLSDIHMGDYQRHRPRPVSSEELLRDVLSILDRPVDFVVVSGDLTSNTSVQRELHPVEFEEGRDFLEHLLRELGVVRERLVVVPGNHDIMWCPPEAGELGIDSRQINDVNYRNFYRAMFSSEPGPSFLTMRYYADHGLICVGLNSCVAESGAESAWIGKVGREQLRRLTEFVTATERNAGARLVKVAVLHHHLVPVSYMEEIRDPSKPVSLTVDAEAVVRRLLTLGFDLALHGHQHQPFTAVESRVYVSSGEGDAGQVDLRRSLVIHGAGSLGAPISHLGTIARNSYSILELNADGISLHVRQSHPEEPGAYQTYVRQRILRP